MRDTRDNSFVFFLYALKHARRERRADGALGTRPMNADPAQPYRFRLQDAFGQSCAPVETNILGMGMDAPLKCGASPLFDIADSGDTAPLPERGDVPDGYAFEKKVHIATEQRECFVAKDPEAVVCKLKQSVTPDDKKRGVFELYRHDTDKEQFLLRSQAADKYCQTNDHNVIFCDADSPRPFRSSHVVECGEGMRTNDAGRCEVDMTDATVRFSTIGKLVAESKSATPKKDQQLCRILCYTAENALASQDRCIQACTQTVAETRQLQIRESYTKAGSNL